ncbi:MAG: glucokinase [Halioglobus sp.]|nr:glucokinase [Halioglobus sp.]
MVGDVGGTNTRLALFAEDPGELLAVASYNNRDFRGLADVIATWLEALDAPRPTAGCLAIAAPPFGDTVSMLNIDWSFSLSDLASKFGFRQLRGINDFEGIAYSLPYLGPQEAQVLRASGEAPAGKLATVGPGTGLGGATLALYGDTPVANASEPGHMGLAPATLLELELFRALLPEFGEVYAELLLSGPGLQRLHHCLGEVLGEPAPVLSPGEISALGVRGESALCTQTLELFCGLLGSVCGDYVLATGSYGGLYLAGGIVPRMVDFVGNSSFAARFDAKGQMAGYLGRVPLFAITHGNPGLLGAAHAPLWP